MQIANNTVVSIHYTLRDEAGSELDSSAGGEPLVYLHGAGNIISGLETELAGMQAGDDFTAVIPPADAYGEMDPQLVREVPLDALAGIDDVRPGMRLQGQSSDGRTQILTVTKVGEETVTLDANHMLAGMTLHFEGSVQDVRAATAEELEHGHVHG